MNPQLLHNAKQGLLSRLHVYINLSEPPTEAPGKHKVNVRRQKETLELQRQVVNPTRPETGPRNCHINTLLLAPGTQSIESCCYFFAEYFESRSLPGKTPGLQSDPPAHLLGQTDSQAPMLFDTPSLASCKTHMNACITTRCQVMTLHLLQALRSQVTNGEP